ncbi:hypothetical protein A0H81_15034 [Grifola frondosa]|uniref:Uncharacterized protein n=1 Tax=Grifola frondosa TaxID=5627 RepID=A0A1C7LQ77_GRIFR|nr:hypothetical protein A0H81_15034 [Grifola frondosa]
MALRRRFTLRIFNSVRNRDLPSSWQLALSPGPRRLRSAITTSISFIALPAQVLTKALHDSRFLSSRMELGAAEVSVLAACWNATPSMEPMSRLTFTGRPGARLVPCRHTRLKNNVASIGRVETLTSLRIAVGNSMQEERNDVLRRESESGPGICGLRQDRLLLRRFG